MFNTFHMECNLFFPAMLVFIQSNDEFVISHQDISSLMIPLIMFLFILSKAMCVNRGRISHFSEN